MKFKYLIKLLFLFMIADISAQESNLKKFKQLSGPEKCWVICHPFVAKKALRISEKARKETESIKREKLLFGNGNGNGEQLDAFRHTFWMANLTMIIGWRRAKKLGEAHEKGNYKAYKKGRNEDGEVPDKISSEMDFYNNNVGINIGKKSDSYDLKNIVISAVKEGRCKIIKKDDKGNYLDCEGTIIPKEDLKGKWENDKCLVDSNVNQ